MYMYVLLPLLIYQKQGAALTSYIFQQVVVNPPSPLPPSPPTMYIIYTVEPLIKDTGQKFRKVV